MIIAMIVKSEGDKWLEYVLNAIDHLHVDQHRELIFGKLNESHFCDIRLIQYPFLLMKNY